MYCKTCTHHKDSHGGPFIELVPISIYKPLKADLIVIKYPCRKPKCKCENFDTGPIEIIFMRNQVKTLDINDASKLTYNDA